MLDDEYKNTVRSNTNRIVVLEERTSMLDDRLTAAESRHANTERGLAELKEIHRDTLNELRNINATLLRFTPTIERAQKGHNTVDTVYRVAVWVTSLFVLYHAVIQHIPKIIP